MAAARLVTAFAAVAALGWAAAEALRAASVEESLASVSQQVAALPANASLPAPRHAELWRELELAESRQPRNPAVHELKGLLSRHRFDAPEIAALASAHFIRAIALRPVSPTTWANLVQAKYEAGDTSGAFGKVLATAALLGPSAPHVQRMVAHYGLAVWDEVSEPVRAAIDASLAAGMRRNPLEMLRIAQRRGRLAIACRHLAGIPLDPKWAQLCPSREATR